MMEDRHVTNVEIAKLARRELAPAEILAVARHLEECPSCRHEARLSPEAQLVDSVFDFDDVEPHRLRRGWTAAAAVAAIAAAIIVVVTLRSPGPSSAPPRRAATAPPAVTPAPAETAWDVAVRDALAHGIARPAIVAEIRPRSDALRGKAQSNQVTLHPAGEVIDTAQPRLTWTPFRGARYVVTISDGNRAIASSAPLASASWIPPVPLPRAVMLIWQVEVRRAGRTEIIPAPPQPPAMFQIIDETTANDLAAAEQRRPNDHLLLGVLCARAGLKDRAERELQAASSADAARLLSEVQRW